MSTIPNFLQTRGISGDPGLPQIDPSPVAFTNPPSMPVATAAPTAKPPNRFAESLMRALPIILATIANKQGGPLAGAGLLEGYTSQAERQRQIDQHQHELDVAQSVRDEEKAAKAADRAQAQVAALNTFIEHQATTMRADPNSADPTWWAAATKRASVVAQRAFGAKPGDVESHPALQFSDAKALGTAKKDAQAALDRAQKNYSPEQWAKIIETPDQFAIDGTPISDLIAAAGSAVTQGGKPVAPTVAAKAPPAETESTFIQRAIASENTGRAAKKLPPLSDTETNAIALKARKDWMAQSGQPGDSVTDMTDEAIADTAMRYHLFGSSAIPTRINEDKRTRILNENAKINAALGQTPAQAIMKQLSLKADATSLNRSTTLADASRAAQAKAEPQAALIEQLSDKVGRSGIPILNDAILLGKTKILGDDNASLLLNALTEFTSEYAKIIEGSANSSGGATVDGRRAAASLITGAMTKGTVRKQLAQMKQIMDWTIQGYDLTREAIQNRMTAAGTPAVQTPPPATPPPADVTAPVKGTQKPLQLSTDQPGQPTGVQQFDGKNWIRIR